MKSRSRKLYLGVGWSYQDVQYTIRIVSTSPETFARDKNRYLQHWGSGDQMFRENRFFSKTPHYEPKSLTLTRKSVKFCTGTLVFREIKHSAHNESCGSAQLTEVQKERTPSDFTCRGSALYRTLLAMILSFFSLSETPRNVFSEPAHIQEAQHWRMVQRPLVQ